MFTRLASFACVASLLALFSAAGLAGDKKKVEKKAEPKKQMVWTDPNDPTLPPDFKIQGEYAGSSASGAKLGAQIIALGEGAFQAVLLPGGLPGDGWDGKHKTLMHGKLDGERALFTPIDGKEKRKYLAQRAEEFSATSTFPPKGHMTATATAENGKLVGKLGDGGSFELARIERKSPTMGQKAPPGAIVLFDGTNTDAFKGGRLDKKTGLLNTDGANIHTKQKFLNYSVHVEFMLPYRPDARGQGRGNSGFYQVDQYEVQILDSFGLDGKNNECGGIYSRIDPKLNMCGPPLTWQTYDIDFTAAELEGGKKVKDARITVRLNGVVVHDNVSIPGVTGGARNEPEGTPGALQLQGHGNPLQFRNFWVVTK
jgi:hypothetical protein